MIQSHIDNAFSKCLKHEKTFFIYVFIGHSLIKTSLLLILDIFVGPRPATRNPSLSPILLHLFGTEDYVFQNRSFPCNDRVQEEETKTPYFWGGGVYVWGPLLVVNVCLLVVCSYLLVVCGGFWSFVFVACFSIYNSLLISNIENIRFMINLCLFWCS